MSLAPLPPPQQATSALPTISIVTLSFDQGRFLGECLDSVAAQAYPALDHVIVDPGSADGSRELVQARHAAFGTVLFEPDRGPADGLNKGFAHAIGSVFGYLNADDRLLPGALHAVGDFFVRHPDVDVLCGAIRLIDEHGRPARRKRTADPFDPVRYVAGVCTVGQQATFMRRAAFASSGGFNPDNRISWDGELLVDLALAGARFATTDTVLADFRRRAGTISQGPEARQRLDQETCRIAARLAARGLRPVSPAQQAWLRLAYRCDLRRHWRYLRARPPATADRAGGR